ncbi:hypothetical protein ACFYWX_41020 [Streptomyces sp. NPDC002888]
MTPTYDVEAANCMYSKMPDEHFVIARHPAHPIGLFDSARLAAAPA